MSSPKQEPADVLIDIPLDEEQLAQIDALIEEHSTPSHRLTREEMLQLLIEKGSELVESLLPFLEPPSTADEDHGAPSSAPDVMKH